MTQVVPHQQEKDGAVSSTAVALIHPQPSRRSTISIMDMEFALTSPYISSLHHAPSLSRLPATPPTPPTDSSDIHNSVPHLIGLSEKNDLCYFTCKPIPPTSTSPRAPAAPTITPGPSSHLVETPGASPTFSSIPETPSDPTHPLLALRLPPLVISPPKAMDSATSFLQLQTAAAYGSSASSSISSSSGSSTSQQKRPGPFPLQSYSSASSGSPRSSDSDGEGAYCDSKTTEYTSREYNKLPTRCSRCHYEEEGPFGGRPRHMVSFGVNLWYCGRCASLVGFRR